MTHGRKFDQPSRYQIRVQGNLDPKWSAWFTGFSITPQAGGDTLITGEIIDQSDLYGLLEKIRDLGLPLLCVERLKSESPPYKMNRDGGEDEG
jgi:hypothetical protein